MYANRIKVRVSLFADDTLYLKDPKDSTRKCLNLINHTSKVAGYKINIQKKSVVLIYTNNEMMRRKSEKSSDSQ
jgi:hypothetical protein